MVLKTMIFNFTTYANKYFCTAIQICICIEHTQKCMVISYFSFEILSAICLGFKTAKSNQVLSKQLDTLLYLMFLVPICLGCCHLDKKNDRINRAQFCVVKNRELR